MNDTLKMLKDVMEGMSPIELAVIGEHAARLLCDRGQVASFVQGVQAGAEVVGATAAVAKGGGSPRFWAKAVPLGSVDYTKTNGYAFTGPWVRSRDVEKMVDGELVVMGQDGQYGLAKVVKGHNFSWQGRRMMRDLELIESSSAGIEPILAVLRGLGV